MHPGVGFSRLWPPGAKAKVVDIALRLLVHGITPADDPAAAAAKARSFADAGATWWAERINASRGTLAQMREWVQAGPPRF